MELKEILDALDITIEGDLKDVTAATLHAALQTKYIARALAPKDEDIRKAVVGNTLDTIESKLIKGFVTAGLERDQLKGFRISEFDHKADGNPFSLLKTKHDTALAAFEGIEGGDEKYKKLKEDYDKVLPQLATHKELLTQKNHEYEALELKHNTELKTTKIENKQAEIHRLHPLSSTASKFEIKGLNGTLKDEYKYDLDEAGELVITDLQGKPVPNSKGSGLASYEDIYVKEAGPLLQKHTAGGNGKETPAPKVVRPDNELLLNPKAQALADEYASMGK